MQSSFTIQASDKPYAGRCSRCNTEELGARPVSAEWNGITFTYCTECAFKQENQK